MPSTPDPSGRTVVLENSDYDRISQSAKFLTMEDKKQLEVDRKNEMTARMEASHGRKEKMQELEYLRKKNEKLSDLDQVRKLVSIMYSTMSYLIRKGSF